MLKEKTIKQRDYHCGRNQKQLPASPRAAVTLYYDPQRGGTAKTHPQTPTRAHWHMHILIHFISNSAALW